MTTFDERERAFENKFVREQDLVFSARAIRNRRIANWAAEQAGLPPQEWFPYEAEIVRCGVADGDDAVVQRLRSVLDAAGIAVSEHQLRRRMADWLDEDTRGLYSPTKQQNAL